MNRQERIARRETRAQIITDTRKKYVQFTFTNRADAQSFENAVNADYKTSPIEEISGNFLVKVDTNEISQSEINDIKNFAREFRSLRI